MATKGKELVKTATEEQLAILDASYPVDDSSSGPRLPRLGMLAKDVIEGTGKKMKVVQEAGTFFTEKETDEEKVGEDGKKRKVWEKTFLEGVETIEAVIFFNRKQLRLYDSADEKWINSPIFDSMDENLPLYKGSAQIAQGPIEKLQAMYPGLTAKGKPTSKLKIEKILYILYEGEIYQVNLTQSSKFAFSDYEKKVGNVSRFVTTIGSLEQTHGSNTYKVMTFEKGDVINAEQADIIVPEVVKMNEMIKRRMERNVTEDAADKEQRELVEGLKKSKSF